MNIREIRKWVTILFLLVGVGTGVVSGLTLQEVIARVDTSIEVRRAISARENALQQVETSAYRGDPTFSFSPGIRADGYDDSDQPDRWAATISLNAGIPTGLSYEQQTRLDRARDELARAEMQLQHVRNEQIQRIVVLFNRVWLREREVVLLERERSLLQELVRLERLRFDRGEVAWDALVRVQGDYRNAQAEVAEVRGELRSAVIELALAATMRPEDVYDLSRPAINTLLGTLDVPPVAAPVRIQTQALATAIREASATVNPISHVMVRVGLDLYDHAASLTYSFLNPTVNLAWTPPLLVLKEHENERDNGGGGGSDYDWTVSLGATIALSGTGSTRLARTAQATIVDREAAVLEYVEAQAEARVHNAQTGLEQAERDLGNLVVTREQSQLALEIMEARARTGQVRPVELELARVAVERAEYAVTRAELVLEETRLALTLAGGAESTGRDL